MLITLRPDDEILLELETKVQHQKTDNVALSVRIENEVIRLMNENDDWSRRFALLTPLAESYSREKIEAKLSRVVRQARIKRSEIARVFADTAISFGFTRGEDWEELTVYAGESRRATARQESEVSGALGGWSDRIAHYLDTMEQLNNYLAARPDRAEALFGEILKDVDDESEQRPASELSEDEQKIVRNVSDAMGEVGTALQVEETETHTLDELSLLVYDPFPAHLTIKLPAKILESEGFERISERSVAVHRAGLWSSYQRAAKQWLSPDPLTTWIETHRDSKRDRVRISAYAQLPRRVERKSSAEIRARVEKELRPQSSYTVRWAAEIERPETGENQSPAN